tara:strand:- start:537 stop:1175 length:639 start_codon:yes stop_codon:yes gene_type:complete
MKNPALLFTVLLLIGCGKSEDKPEVKSSGKDSASAKETDGNGDSKKTKVPKNPPSKTNSKSGTRTIPTRRVPTRSVPAKKTEKHADKNSTEPAHANPKPNVLAGKHDPPSRPEEALVGSWLTSHDGFEFTIILNKGGKGEMRIAEGDRKATPHMITWKADSEKLTLVNKDFKTHDEDVTEGVYKLSNENGIKSLQLEYELEKQEFTFFSVKD